MYFQPGGHRDKGLSHNPLKAIVAPRPVGWVGSVDGDGRHNLAPFSFFNLVSEDPPMVLLGISGSRTRPDGLKDTARNLLDVPEFVLNFADWSMRHTVHRSGADFPADVNEAEALGLALVPSVRVRPPRIQVCLAHLECVVQQVVDLPPGADRRRSKLFLGEVVGIHLAEGAIRDGRFDLELARPLSRLGYRDYATIGALEELI